MLRLFTAVLLCIVCPAMASSPSAELALMRDRMLAELLDLPAPSEDGVKAAQAGLSADGSFADLDYQIRPQLGLPSLPHLKRLVVLATAYRHPRSSLAGDSELKERINRAISFWISANPFTEHHWFLEIGAPIELGKIGILLGPDLLPVHRDGLVGMMKYGFRNGDYFYGNGRATGQNLIWVTRAQIEAGAISGDYDHALRASQAFAGEIRVSAEEGIQMDASFHQHGPQLYSGGYGASFSMDVVRMARLTRGTALALPPDKIALVARHILDGQQWMIRGGSWDFGAIGREVARSEKSAATMAPAVRTLAEMVPDRAAEATAFARRLTGEAPPDAGVPLGNRVFWRSDFAAHSRPGYLATVHMASRRTIGSESGNGENELGYYLSHGAFALQKTGREYSGIYPLWNWRRIPGITAVQNDTPTPDFQWGKNARCTTSFAGGVSDGQYGAAASDFDQDGLRARKAWFFFDDEIVCLGTGISSESPDPVATTLDQSRLTGSVTVLRPGGVSPVTAGEISVVSDATALIHGDTGYVFPNPQALRVQVEERSGNWTRINTHASSMHVRDQVFTAWLDHGKSPSAASYAYIVVPQTDAGRLATFVAPRILANTPDQQAVWHDGLRIAQVVFHAPGSITLPDGSRITADQACLVMLRHTGSGRQITVADPTQHLIRLRLTVTDPAGAPREWQVDPPAGLLAGSSIKLAP